MAKVQISKGKIERWIVPHLSIGQRGPEPNVEIGQIMEAILYRLKTGVQWRYLPPGEFFEKGAITWNGVYHHHREWIKDGSWRKAWIAILQANRHLLDLSSVQLDGSHTPAKKQGQNIGYQGRKAADTTNGLFLSDNSGQPLAIAPPQAGNHHDAYEIQTLFTELCSVLEAAGIDLAGVFLNADSGCDCGELRQMCSEKEVAANIDRNKRSSKEPKEDYVYVYFDEDLYKRRCVMERANAWIDGFKTLIIRYEGLISTWMAAHFMAFIVSFLKAKF